MPIEYNKKNKREDKRNRSVVTRGPSDNYRRQRSLEQITLIESQQEETIGLLRDQIKLLKERITELESSSISKGYTTEQFNTELENAIKEETKTQLKEIEVLNAKINELKKKLDNTNKELESKDNELKSLTIKLDNKESMINDLQKNQENILNNKLTELLSETNKKFNNLEESLRNKEFSVSGKSEDSQRPGIDTVFIDPIEGDSNYESHIEVKENTMDGEVNMQEKSDKLKKLFNKKQESKD